jgi:hypothetical protein
MGAHGRSGDSGRTTYDEPLPIIENRRSVMTVRRERERKRVGERERERESERKREGEERELKKRESVR